MKKILYTVPDTIDSYHKINRIVPYLQQEFNVKIAAHVKNYPWNIEIDWNLDYLEDFIYFNPPKANNQKLDLFSNQIKNFKPDLIISELEPYISYLGIEMKIPVWQLNPILLHFGMPHKIKHNLAIQEKYPTIFSKYYFNDLYKFMLNNSDKKLIYSHFCDIEAGFELLPGYEWIRPYAKIGKKSIPHQHNIVAVSSNKQLIEIIKNQKDVVLFSDQFEKYQKINIKKLNNLDYAGNLFNAKYVYGDGVNSFLVDAFYNRKKSYLIKNPNDSENFFISTLNECFGLSQDINSIYFKLNDDIYETSLNYNSTVKFLTEYIKDNL